MYISLDIGGTKLMVAAFNADRKLVRRERADTPRSRAAGIALLKSLVRSVAHGCVITSIGASAGGPLNHKTGVVSPLHMPEWRDVPLKEIFEDEFRVPFAVDVDTNTAALAEYSYGGHNVDRLLYVTVSTGVGGGFVVDGELYRGTNGAHPEIGHQTIAHTLKMPGPIACSCGASDCLEAIVSGSAIRVHYGRSSEELSEVQWQEVGCHLARGLRNAVALYAPAIVSLGGGVCIGGGKLLLDTIHSEVTRSVRIVPHPRIVLSSLGYDTALWGGLEMAVRAQRNDME